MALTLRGNGQITSDNYTIDSDGDLSVSGNTTVAGAFTSRGIDDNADATAITITSQENVGIGTASPSNYGAAYTSLGVSGSSAATIEGFVGNTLVGYLHAYNAQVLVGSKTNVPLKLVTNDTIQMTIDGSGYVNMPKQPVFSYLGSKSHVIAATGTAVMSSSNVWSASVNHALNRGSHFNASNGRFTAPVAGTYAFNFRCQASNFGSGYLWFYFNINGSTKSYAQKSQEAAHTFISHYMIAELAASDYVDASWTNNYVSGQIHYPCFSGHLIG